MGGTDGHAAGAGGRSGSAADPARRRARHTTVRRALRMPPGTFEDTAEAAEYLVRIPRVLFLVDGYNVAKAGWPELELRHQRDRLVEALVALQARTGAQTDVVFDGVDDAGLHARVGPGRLRVEFTPSHLEADDRLLELVELTPAARPVVVVSSDRRVRDGARRRGANTLRSEQLLWLLR
ncbi:MAG: NYN domain-containing protein [Acidimicrobiales bacterium]